MKNTVKIIVAGGVFSAGLLGLHAWYFGGAVAIADMLVWLFVVSAWSLLVGCLGGQPVPPLKGEIGINTGRFIHASNAFHKQLGNEISDQLTSASTELGNTQVILNDAITNLVGNFITISDEVRNLSGNVDKFSAQIQHLVDDVGQSLKLAEQCMDKFAAEDVSRVRESREHIQNMVTNLAKFNDTVTGNAVELNSISNKVEQNVLVVISSLQFQDMSSQLIEHARMRMKALQEVANEMAKRGDSRNSQDYLERIAAYNLLLEKHVISLDKQKTNPVAQKEYRSGDVELF
jgi:ABC-type transporter Mla subunit MlaD